MERALGRRPGKDLPAVYLEHNTPKGDVPFSVHPLADQHTIPLVHVTHFNELFWDSGTAPTVVIEHGIPDPGHLYTGDVPELAVVVNEPVRRGRVTGTDLLARFAAAAPLQVFGMGGDGLPAATGLPATELTVCGDLPTMRLHRELARCRVYLHPLRWTSLGLALLEAMHLGMPVVVLATTEAARAVPPEAGAISTNVEDLVRAAARLVQDPEEARQRGKPAREAALERYGLEAVPRTPGTNCSTSLASSALQDGPDSHSSARKEAPVRISMVSEHASPLAALGGVDAGGQNVHVAALSRALARRGHHVTVYTRRDAVDLPARVRILPEAGSGPRRRRARRGTCPRTICCPSWTSSPMVLPATGAATPPDMVHGHFWMSGLAALDAARRGSAVRVPWSRPSTRWAPSSAVIRAPRTPARSNGSWLEPSVGTVRRPHHCHLLR